MLTLYQTCQHMVRHTKGQFTPNRQTPTNSNKLVCWSLLDQCATPVGVDWSWLEFVFTRLNMLIDIELVGVCWCRVNMTVIFHKILNPTANLSQLVCWRLSVRCELAFRHTKPSLVTVFFLDQASVRASYAWSVCDVRIAHPLCRGCEAGFL